ncbi:hypothetical protein [Pandoraea apista]|uniref:Uncharacterized protein n=1 Tax=Pandoraea apista TaxID=93218 RepID=A0ABX9ZHB4_9BURK|nr:hypothetical protein [Pandoraea apista]PTD98343.1 hypothetical protein C7830_24890 [Pandoraea apista]RRJ25332.1 hypothetical protein EIB05_24275 [Pandoraea apista]RRJ72206.1 hypothetical protein EIL82_24155 [Pandoraea apista]RSC93648.1 hypothetical protein EJB12_25545 [Pandoraea apista]RSD08318.1 hypothetical protein EIZ52_24615 [Pandoraea apista]
MVAAIETFSNEFIAHIHRDALLRYVKLRADGHTSIAALTGAFGHEYAMTMNPFAYINLIETSDAYKRTLVAAVAEKKDNPVWDSEQAARVLFSIATDETAKRAERITAAKELNVLFGITIIDDKGNTRRGGLTLDDLLKMTPSALGTASKAH